MRVNIRRRKRDAGLALLEFALSLFAVLLVLFGTIDIGRAAFAYDWVANAARQGTRFAMVRGTSCSGLSGGCPASATDISNYVKSIGLGIDTSQLTITSGCFAGETFLSTPPCAPKGYVKVTVQYNFRFLSPLSPRSWRMQSISQRVVAN